MGAIHVYQRPTLGTAFVRDITRLAWPTWRDTTRALGGYWTAEFSASSGQATISELWDIYHTYIGRRIRREEFGLTCWEGIVYEMTYEINGTAYTITLDSEQFHNKVKVQYTYPRVEDTQQGVLAYDPGGAVSTFQDTLQDFSAWDTAAPGTAVYECVVTNDDTTTVHFYCGDVATVTNPNDSIRTYLDLPLTTMGYNGEQAGKTPISYVVRNVERAGVSEQTAWSETTDSSDEYGEACYIDVRGEMAPAVAEGIRNRQLAEHAYPRSRPAGGLANDSVGAAGRAQLSVICAGFAYTMNWRYMEADVGPDAVSDQVTLLVDGTADAAEFITAGTIESNILLTPTLTGGNMSIRLWDQCEELAEMGDGAGTRYIAGVHRIPAGTRLYYRPAETAVYYYWRHGRLVNQGGQPVHPALVQPDIIVQVQDMPYGITMGAANAFHNPRQFYVEEVEFIAPNMYRLIPYEGDALAYYGGG